MALMTRTESVSDIASREKSEVLHDHVLTNPESERAAATIQNSIFNGTSFNPKVQATWSSLFHFTSREHTVILTSGIVLAVISGVVIPATSILFGKLFDSFALYGASEISADELVSRTSRLSIALAVLGSGSWLLNGGFFMLWVAFGELQAKAVRNRLFQSLLYKDMGCQIRELQIASSQPLGFLIQNSFTALAAFGVALYNSWNLTLVTIATFPIAAVILSILSAKTQSSINDQVEALADASRLATNAVSAIETVKLHNGQSQETRQYSKSIKKAALSYFKIARANALQIGIIRLAMRGMFVQGFWYGSTLIKPGGKSAGQVLTTFWACLMATQAIQDILPQMIVLEKGRFAGAALRLVLCRLEKETKVVVDSDSRIPLRVCEGDIHFKNVSFAYPVQKDRLAIKDLNLFVPAGEISFIIGKSGSGKSTLGSLLLRLYSPSSGQILLDGEPLEHLDTKWLRENVTLVEQQNVLFDVTILQNILYGTDQSVISDKNRIEKACKFALLQSTINDLEKGLETEVGARGDSLSGGQKQRIALARAYLRNSPVLVLDESTSALDYISRSLIMDSIRKWREGMTTIIITHDISQIFEEDYVYVMEDGQLVQEGTRKKLEKVARGPFRGFYGLHMQSAEEKDGKTQKEPVEGDISDTASIASNDSIVYQNVTEISTPEDVQQSSHYLQTQHIDIHRHVPHLNSSIEPVLLGSPSISTSRGIELKELAMGDQSPNHPMSSSRPFLASSSGPTYSSSSALGSCSSHFYKRRKFQRRNKGRKTTSMPLIKIFQTVWPSLDLKSLIVLSFGFLCALLYAASVPLFSWVFARLLATFYQPHGKSQEAVHWSLAILAVAIGDTIVSFFMHYLLECCGQRWVDSLRIEALKRILDQPRAWFDREKHSKTRLIEYLDRNAEEMRNLVGRFAAFLLVGMAMMSIAIVWSMIISWKLTLVGLATTPLMYAVTRTFEHVSGKWEGKCNNVAEKAAAVFMETFTNIGTVRVLTLESCLYKKHSKITENILRIGLKRSILSGIFFGLADSAILFITSLIFYYGALLVAHQEYTVSDILVVFAMLLFSFSNANAIISFIPQIGSSRDTATRLLYLANLPESSHEHDGNMNICSPLPIVFEGLDFSYPSRHKSLVLRDLNLNIPRGRCTAIVGSSGSGKSTVAALLTRLYPPTQPSRLKVAGIAINNLNTVNLRDHIAVVQQNSTLFPASVAANIAYGLPENLVSGPKIEDAARAAGIHEFVVSLPYGYMTHVGEGGQGLSGGQMQRIAIARALIRQPKVLILDEATSSLDSESARIVKESIERLIETAAGLTVIVITHAKEMMQLADTIAVLEQGSVVETGSYTDLIQKGGWFAKLIGASQDPGKENTKSGPEVSVNPRGKRQLGPVQKETQ